MIARAPFVALSLSILFSVTCHAQQRHHFARMEAGLISGTVRSAEGIPVSGIPVDLRNVQSGALIASTSTQHNGTFEMYNIPQGTYEVVAHDGPGVVRETISVDDVVSNVDLRLASHSSSSEHSGLISVAQMSVPGKARAHFVKAEQFFSKANYPAAQKEADKALAIYPRFAEALTLCGMLAMQKQDTLQSAKDFEAAVQSDPNYGTAYLALGSAYNDMGHYDQAERALERGVPLVPAAWQGYFEMARAYLGKHMYEKATQLASKAESLAPSSFANIHLLKAYTLIPQKLNKEAAHELRAFLSHNPTGTNAERAEKLLASLPNQEGGTPPSGN